MSCNDLGHWARIKKGFGWDFWMRVMTMPLKMK